jgi:hypothetical protein
MLAIQWPLEAGKPIQANGSNPGFGDLRIFAGFDPTHTHCAQASPVFHDGHPTFKHALHGRGRQKRETTAVDDIFVALGLAATQRRRMGFGRGNVCRKRCCTIHSGKMQ